MIRIASALPLYGEPARNFSPAGIGGHSEGLVVDFDGKWHGNFAKGNTTHNALYTQFAPRTVHVISGGNHYLVDTKSRSSDLKAHDWIVASIFSETSATLIVFDLTHATAYQGSRKVWESERIAWDLISSVSEVNGIVHGEGYDPYEDSQVQFELDPLTGQHSGGGYPS